MKNFIKNILFKKGIAKKIAVLLLRLDTLIGRYLGMFLVAAENGSHPKYNIIKYYEFFQKHITEGALVLDVGCGNGVLSKDIAVNTNAHVVGVEMCLENVKIMEQTTAGVKNIEIVNKNIWDFNDSRSFDIIVLSNVIEHIKERVELLRHLNDKFNPKKFLIRVPMFDRDWSVPYKKAHSVEWRLDPTHEIEYTDETLINELTSAGLDIIECSKRWGEMYVVAVPASGGRQDA